VTGAFRPSGRSRFAALFSSKTVEHATPDEVFAELAAEFGPFQLDAAATKRNAKVPTFYTRGQNGLVLPWAPRTYVNPPYARNVTGLWVAKADREARENGCLVVQLLPARTDTAWFHDHVIAPGHEVRFCRGPLVFGSAAAGAPFPYVVVIARPERWRPQ
jgi:phage N-6-adenine-methyltransferase